MTVTWNPDDKHAAYTLSNNNLTAELGTSSVWRLLRATEGKSSGKWYFEVFVDKNPGSGRFEVGVGSTAVPLESEPGAHAAGWVWLNNSNPQARNNTTGVLYGSTYWTTGDIVGCAVDFDAGKIWWSLNGTWTGDPAAGTGAPFTNVSGTLFPLMASNFTGAKGTARFADADLTYTLPSGFSAWGNVVLIKAVVLTLIDRSSDPQANLSNLKWAFFDQVSPDLLAAPVDKGALEATDASGVITIEIPNSTLTDGQTGFLIVSDTGGDAAVDSNAFAAPVVVSLI